MITLAKKIALTTIAACLVTACGQQAEEETKVASTDAAPEAESYARNSPDAGGVERIKVQASGKGENVQVAIDRAIRLAYEQVNGKAFDAATMSLDSKFKANLGDMSLDGGASGYADAIFTATSGSVSDFRILSQQEVDGTFEVLIEASVEQFNKPESASLLRIALSPFRTARQSFMVGDRAVPAADVAANISDALTESLLASNRVTVLGREFDGEIRQELSRINPENWQNEDRKRLGQQLAADFLVVGKIDRFEYVKHERKMRTTDDVITSWSGGASLVYQVVNVATGQIVVADSVDVELAKTKPTTMGASVDSGKIVADLIRGLATEPRHDIIHALFPITVVDVDGDMVALSQGGDAVDDGKTYEIVLRGKEITDPQTGRVIGRLERSCCTVKITNVTSELSYGVIVSQEVADVQAIFKPGALELRGEVAVQQKAAVVAEPETTKIAVVNTASTIRTAPDVPEVEEPEEDPDW